MYNQIIFFNQYGAGDIFESREFIKQWMKLVPSVSYHYAHGKNPRIILDIEGLEFKAITHHMRNSISVLDDSNGNLYVNTWIGRNGKYVLPGVGCTVEKLFDMYNDMLSLNNMGSLPGSPIDYIPSIDYKKYKIDTINKFMEGHPEDKIYIDNGNVQSNQASNFAMNEIIESVASYYKDKCFILSQNMITTVPNVFFSSEIVENSGLGFDLNELSYISTFCTTLIGRNSGPHVYAQVKENCMDANKKLLSFTYDQQGSSFVVNTDVRIQKHWSNLTSQQSVSDKIKEVIG